MTYGCPLNGAPFGWCPQGLPKGEAKRAGRKAPSGRKAPKGTAPQGHGESPANGKPKAPAGQAKSPESGAKKKNTEGCNLFAPALV
jgi:hypothetical protein